MSELVDGQAATWPMPRVASDVPEDCLERGDGALVSELSDHYGLTLDAWQQYLARRWTARMPDGTWYRRTWMLLVPRQNGKSALAEALVLHALVVLGLRVVFTAHEAKTATKLFERMRAYFENDSYPELKELLKQRGIRSGNGNQSITLKKPEGAKNEPFVEFGTRTGTALRGGTIDLLIIDEAQEYTSEQEAALRPMIATSPNALTVMMGTSPGPGSAGDVMLRLRRNRLQGSDSAGWDEWSIPDEMKPTEAVERWRELVEETNPAYPHRVLLGNVADEAGNMDPEEFLRERLGWMPPQGAVATRAISQTLWDRQADYPLDDPDVKTLAIAMSFNGNRIWVAGGMRNAGREVYAELIPLDDLFGSAATMTLANWLTADRGGKPRFRSFSEILIAGGPHGDYLMRELISAGIPRGRIRCISTPEYLDACATTEAGLIQDWLTHPQAASEDDALDAAVAVSDRKKRGQGWGWIPSVEGGDSLPLEAFSVAAWAARTTKKNTSRSGGKIGRLA